jgi:predicted deacylase
MLSEYLWPYFAISGVSPGKTILIVAGSHAGEYAGIEACIRLGRTLDPAQVRGSIIILPLLNVPGFFQRSLYVNPVDGKNMNRQFPGDPQGTWSQRFAFHLFEKVVAPCHYLVDIHDGDLVEDLSPYAAYKASGQEPLDEKMRQMAMAFGAPWVLKDASGDRPGSLTFASVRRAIPSVVVEAGRQGKLEEDRVRQHTDGIPNILRHLGILTDAHPAPSQSKFLSQWLWMYSDYDGIFYSQVQVGDWIEEGQPLGKVTDILGNLLAEVKSPHQGYIMFLVTSPATYKGSPLLSFGIPT